MNRRLLLNATALGGTTLMIACATGTSTATVQAVFNDIQFILPLLDALAVGVSIAVPGAAPILAIVQPALTAAGTLFQGLSATASVSQAQPVVSQISAYLSAAVKAIADTVGAAPIGSRLAGFQPQVRQAQAVLDLLISFVTGVTKMPTAAMIPLPYLHR
jgi:hypothetical protein